MITHLSKRSLLVIPFIAAIGFVACLQPSGANTNAADPSIFSIDHAMKMKRVSNIALSPDGEWVAYVVTRKDEKKDKQFKQIFMTSTDRATTLPMTASYTNASAPQWSPDGQFLSGKTRNGR